MTAVPVQEPPLTRSDLRDELDRMLKHYATKADAANLKIWIVGLLLVAVLNVVGATRHGLDLCESTAILTQICLKLLGHVYVIVDSHHV